MASEETTNGAAAAMQLLHGEDAGIPQLPLVGVSDECVDTDFATEMMPGLSREQMGSYIPGVGPSTSCSPVPTHMAHPSEAFPGPPDYSRQGLESSHVHMGADASALSDDDRTHRKIFVGGLSRNTTAESLREYFSAFGAVHATEVLFDKLTGRSRGFGFVTFEDSVAVNNVVDRHHTVDESQVEVRRAIPREEARQNQPRKTERDAVNDGSGRVFIGGLGDEVTDEVLRGFFSQFGELASANVMIDRDSNRPRGFGFVIYKNPDDADKALGIHKDLGPNCEAKRAQPRNQGLRGMRPGTGGAAPYRMGGVDARYAGRGGRMDYDYQMNYGTTGQGQIYGYNYAYNPYYAAYYAQVAAAYGSGYGNYSQSPTEAGGGGADRSARMPTNRSTPY